MSSLRLPCDGLAPTTLLLMRAGSRASLNGVSSMDLPAYLLRAGLTSKDSTWERPPQRKIQMTDFAGGEFEISDLRFERGEAALASRASMAERARPVKPMPVSARKERRE